MKKILSLSATHNLNYVAKIIVVDNLRKHNNADKLNIYSVDGRNIITDNTTKEGDVRILFPLECAIDREYLSKNNDFRPDENLNSDPKWNKATNPEVKGGGFFTAKGRVKAIAIRQIPSEGYLVPVETLSYILSQKEIDEIKKSIGEEFDTVKDTLLLKKYVIKVVREQGVAGDKRTKKLRKSKIIEGQWNFHFDTSHLGKNMFKISPDSWIVISSKLHGCVSHDTVIETLQHGNLTIKEIYDKKLDCRIKAYDTTNKEIVYVPIDNYYLLKDDGEWYEIELENGEKIQITGNNPVWLPELNCYRKVEDLNENDFLLIDKN